METGLSGKGVLVTGASGGIGAACARAFAAEGARVVVHYHRGEERARDVAASLGGAATLQADLTDEHEVDRLFEESRASARPGRHLRRRRRRLAFRGRPGLAAAARAVGAHAASEPDLLLPHRTSIPTGGRAERPRLARPRRLDSGIVGEAGHADYAAAKAAVQGGLLLSLKNEIVRIAPSARVNAVAPGWTESPMTRGHVDPAAIRRVSRTMALRKVAQPDDVARQVVVLASDELSGHITGQVVTIAGGMEGRVVHDDL